MKKHGLGMLLVMLLLAACGKQTAKVTTAQLDGRWLLLTVEGVGVPVVDAEEQPNMYFNVADSLFACYVGCNRMGGTLLVKEGKLTFGNVFATRMYCEDTIELEDRLGVLLPQITGVSFMEDGTLVLYDSDERQLVTLVKVDAE